MKKLYWILNIDEHGFTIDFVESKIKEHGFIVNDFYVNDDGDNLQLYTTREEHVDSVLQIFLSAYFMINKI